MAKPTIAEKRKGAVVKEVIPSMPKFSKSLKRHEDTPVCLSPCSNRISRFLKPIQANIPLVYRDLTRKPTHILVVFSASKYGDYFHGGKGSLLYVDDFSLVYGDNPTVK